MALLFIDGFDHYATADIGKKYSSSSGAAISATGGRRGGGCLQLTGGSSANVVRAFTPTTTIIAGFAFYAAQAMSSSVTNNTYFFGLLDSANGWQNAFGLNSDGSITAYRGAGTAALGSSATGVIPAATWVYIEIQATANSTTGSVVVRVNGNAVINLSNVNTLNSSNVNYGAIYPTYAPATGQTFSYDDLYICDTSGSINNAFLGDCRVDIALPNANGTYQQAAILGGGNPIVGGVPAYQAVSDATPDTSTYIDDYYNGDKNTFKTGGIPIPSSPGSIFGVQLNLAAAKDNMLSRSVVPMIRSGTIDATGPDTFVGSQSQLYYSAVFQVDPKTNSAWTYSGVNAAEVGFEVGSQ